MKYVGSGILGKLVAQRSELRSTTHDFLWGKRIFHTKPDDLRNIWRKRVMYLDTVDMASSNVHGKLWWWWLLRPYRLEKCATYLLLRVLASSVTRLHVPAIVDSGAWKNLLSQQHEPSVDAPGFSYKSLLDVIIVFDDLGSSGRMFSSAMMFDVGRRHGITIDIIAVRSDVNASKLLNSML